MVATRFASRRLAVHPLPSSASRRAEEIRRVERDGYKVLEVWRERDGSFWGKFEAPSVA